MSKPRYGDHISVNRGEYSHHGIYVGKGKVIHYDNDFGLVGKIASRLIERQIPFIDFDEPTVRETSFEKFLNGSDEYRVHLYDDAGNEKKVITKRYSD